MSYRKYTGRLSVIKCRAGESNAPKYMITCRVVLTDVGIISVMVLLCYTQLHVSWILSIQTSFIILRS